MATDIDSYIKNLESTGDGSMRQKAVLLAGDMHRAYDDWLTTIPRVFIHNDGSTKEFPCKSGCSFCCYMPVHVLEIEIILIVTWVYQIKGKISADQFGINARHAMIAVGDAKDEQRMSLRVRCPFLLNGVCGIYEVRPIACRSFFSPDAKACERERDEPEKVGGQVMAKEPKIQGENLIKQTIAIAERMAIPSGMYDLIESADAALNNSEFARRVMSGQSGFIGPSKFYSFEYVMRAVFQAAIYRQGKSS